ncbi:MAG: GH1 family beta-glucosidase [Chloroflexota bacterium]
MPFASFPDGFTWGASTSSYQIEGAVRADGREESIWDVFCHRPGAIADGSSGKTACDAYHRVPGDIALMRELGLGGYRFSIAWPRIHPDGSSRVNQPGLDHYRRLVEALLDAGIAPMATLYHWDLPRPLQSRGGWTNRDTAARLGEFAYTVGRALGDLVPRFVTVNEPWVHAWLGHYLGIHAPGLRDLRAALAADHHLLLGHAEALEALRATAPRAGAGIALVLSPASPASDSNADLEAAHRQDGAMNRWYLDALYRGAYPADLLEHFRADLPEIAAGDLARISRPTDFLAVNYYFRSTVRWKRGAGPLDLERVVPPNARVNGMGFEIDPDGLHEMLVRVHRDYAPAKIVIAENGISVEDRLVDGKVDDPARERYLHDHLLAVHRAISEGAPVDGYYCWSLLDNFEWNLGYTQRFGLVYTDFATQDRIIKRSGRWYAGVTRENGVPA